MNAPLRRVSVAVLVLFALLFVNLNYVQFFQNDFYRNHPLNDRVQLQEYQRKRGDIILDDRTVLATSKDTGRELRFARSYPLGAQYAHIVGWKSLELGKYGIEAEYNSILSGDDDSLFVRRVSDIVTGRQPTGGTVVLTIDKEAQEIATKALSGKKGSIVAIDPKSGRILAMASSPGYDPNPLVVHNPAAAKRAMTNYRNDPNKPMRNRATEETYPPGSTFKVVMSALALQNGLSKDDMVPAGESYKPPQTSSQIRNSDHGNCGGNEITLAHALTVSCNTAFSQLGVRFGADAVRDAAKAWGFEDNSLRIPMKVVPSRTGPMDDPPKLAQSSIGQRDVRMTTMQGALIAATVANDGKMMQPYLVQEVKGPDFSTLETAREKVLREPCSPEVARELRDMMANVVNDGTGRAARVDGASIVGGKTGTAQNAENADDHGWFIGFAEKGGRSVAVSVFTEQAGKGGSGRAAGMAGDVMRTVLNGK